MATNSRNEDREELLGGMTAEEMLVNAAAGYGGYKFGREIGRSYLPEYKPYFTDISSQMSPTDWAALEREINRWKTTRAAQADGSSNIRHSKFGVPSDAKSTMKFEPNIYKTRVNPNVNEYMPYGTMFPTMGTGPQRGIQVKNPSGAPSGKLKAAGILAALTALDDVRNRTEMNMAQGNDSPFMSAVGAATKSALTAGASDVGYDPYLYAEMMKGDSVRQWENEMTNRMHRLGRGPDVFDYLTSVGLQAQHVGSGVFETLKNAVPNAPSNLKFYLDYMLSQPPPSDEQFQVGSSEYRKY